MTIVQALVLSFVEGITEFLPISSTGHLILVSKLLSIPPTEFVKSFEIIIQFGAILAVAVLYFQRILRDKQIWSKIILAFIPTGVLGLALYKTIKKYLLGSTDVVLWSLLIGGIIMILLEKFVFKKEETGTPMDKLPPKKSLTIGVIQSLSMIPGVSRAAATIFGGMGVGLNRKDAVEFSFLLAIPTMFAASGLDLVKSGFNFSSQEFLIIGIGFVGAFLTALLSVKWLVQYVQKHDFVAFGVYRIVVALIFLLFLDSRNIIY